MERDWTVKMKSQGYGDLCNKFSHITDPRKVPSEPVLDGGDMEADSDRRDKSCRNEGEESEDSSDDNKDVPWEVPEPSPEDDKDNLGSIPEVICNNNDTLPHWTPSHLLPTPPPTPDLIDQRIKDIEEILQPRRRTGL
jgi:hypothetical protein